eukprot:TRINITY_DN908_c0_g3_i4.p1 TRINITY_DN908_c0_g3~~TRINITY_DN908_c0_g3_i4.p1  ORF type:complete len:232 (+),score=59.63 TRINITY_DN908_c0_g3_i4:66-761(+)
MAPSMSQETRRAAVLGTVALAAGLYVAADAFVSGFAGAASSETLRGAALARTAGGEYTGFVPDMQRRTLMNVVITAASAIPVGVILGGLLWYLYPPMPKSGGGELICGDKVGNPIAIADWKANHTEKSVPELVQGYNGDPFYVFSTSDGIKDFACDAVCTHLGCVVPWSAANNKFMCPCHGSQYDANGMVVHGPAPLSLALAHTTTASGNIGLTPWVEEDFRTGLKPWWSY